MKILGQPSLRISRLNFMKILLFVTFLSATMSSLSQYRKTLTLHKVHELNDSIISNEIALTNFFSDNFSYLKLIDRGDFEKIIISENEWSELEAETKRLLAEVFQIQRFLYFSDKEIELNKWHFDFIVNSYHYLIPNKLFDMVKLDLLRK